MDMMEGSDDPFVKALVPLSAHPRCWDLEAVLAGRSSDLSDGKDPATLNAAELAESFARTHEHRSAAKMLSQRRKLPPLLNERALFTRAAPYGDKDDPLYHSACNRIGTNFSPASSRAAAILFEQFPQDPSGPRRRAIGSPADAIRSTQSTSKPMSPRAALPAIGAGRGDASPIATGKRSSPDVAAGEGGADQADSDTIGAHRGAKTSRQLAPEDESQLIDAILRYHYYVEVGVNEDKHVAPFREQWAANALSLVPAGPPPMVSQEYYDGLVATSLEEMHDEYVTSMKRAVVDYIIRSPIERRRLDLEALEPLLSSPSPVEAARRGVVERALPPTWAVDVDTAREEVAWTLQTLSANALELSMLWHRSGFASQTLVDVSDPGFVDSLPMQISAFQSYQDERIEAVKSQLWTSWAPKSVEVFNLLPPVFINGDADAYYRSIATLQSNQLRDLVARSLDAFTQFFAEHTPVDTIDPQSDTLMWSVPPAFVLELVAEADGTPSFAPSFQECEYSMRGCLDSIVTSVAGLPRVGSNAAGANFALGGRPDSAAAGAPPPPGSGGASVIPTPTLHEEAVVSARKAVMECMAANARAPQLLARLFEPWMWLASEETETRISEFSDLENAPSLDQYRAEIERLKAAAEAVCLLCTDTVRTGVYAIHTSELKDLLILSSESLQQRLLDQARLRSSVTPAGRQATARHAGTEGRLLAEVGAAIVGTPMQPRAPAPGRGCSYATARAPAMGIGY
ncbi:hypothetical protein FOA52_015301 [Chlamydomonas sp. UWO 241]|nr:hypothetical protein FOA52_015301 [Chlamydomonas sp. UWO 241]